MPRTHSGVSGRERERAQAWGSALTGAEAGSLGFHVLTLYWQI